MHKGIRLMGIVGLLVLALAGSASATHGGIHPSFKENKGYFHCVGGDTAKVQNLNYPNPFDGNAPTRSFQEGAGCGMADPGFLINTGSGGGPADSSFAGATTGNLKNMTVEMFLLGNYNYGPVFGDIDLDVWLTIDGETFLDPASALVTPPLVSTNSGATQKIEFTITGLGSATTAPDGTVTATGLATEDGDGVQERAINLTVRAHFADTVSLWVFDAKEVPGGITFNDATPSSTKIAVQV